MLIATRNPENMAMTVITPFFLMLLFGTIFGGITDIGAFNYIDFIVPGIILQSVAQGAQFGAINITSDMTKGIIDRFRSMPISKTAVLIGHASASIVKNSVTAAVIIGTAFLIGFRPQGGLTGWLMAVGIFLLFIVAISWMAILFGLLSKTPESTAGYMFPLFILPFVSSGFAPTETLPRGIRWFANHQPMTPIIDSTRGLMMNLPTGNNILLAVLWCVGITVVAFVMAVQVYKRKLM
jgi:ABC-2 type transport system permease protein